MPLCEMRINYQEISTESKFSKEYRSFWTGCERRHTYVAIHSIAIQTDAGGAAEKHFLCSMEVNCVLNRQASAET
jgi:hypothetical protein